MVYIGKDATDAMMVLHPPYALEKLHSFYIGDLDPNEVDEHKISKSFLKLNETLKERGFYNVTPFFYLKEFFKLLFLWSMVFYLVCFQTTDLGYLIGALCLGFMWHQIAFVAHDGTSLLIGSWSFWSFSL
jgi:hypothetical protein